MKLPNIDSAIIEPEKLREYLLSSSHPVGRYKSDFFQVLGFTNENWEDLEMEIRDILRNDAQEKEETYYGKKYEIRGTISGPMGRRAEIVTAWIILKEEEIPRFVTAYPGG